MWHWLHLLNSPLCGLTSVFSILWRIYIYIYFFLISVSLPFSLLLPLNKRDKLAINSQVEGCLWELCCSFWVTPRASLETLSFCPGDLGWFSASDSLSCHLIEEGTRRLPLSWNWCQNHWPYCINLSFCSPGCVISYLSIVKF